MLMPSIFGGSLLDDFFDTSFGGANNQHLMSTDVKETETGYEITSNLPGYSKDDIKCELKNGYLTINATSKQENDTKGKDGKYIRRERYTGSCTRSFYVGNHISQEDIKAKYSDGILTLQVPKKNAQPEIENKQFISIE